MAVCNTNSTRSFVDQRFAHQRSNLDMRHINDRCGANEHKGQLNKRNHWLISFLSLATIIHTSYLTMAAICEDNTILSVPLASTILLFSVGLWFGRKQKNLYYLATIPFATLMILLTTFISHSNLKNVNLFLFAGIIVITGTTLIIYFILHLKRQWYGTEE